MGDLEEIHRRSRSGRRRPRPLAAPDVPERRVGALASLFLFFFGPPGGWLAFAFAVIGLAATGCGLGDEAPSPAPGGEAAVEEALSIVSLSPLATRFVVALGGAPKLVGVDAVSAADPGLEALPRIGLRTAGVLAPDLVLLPEGVPASDPDRRALEQGGATVVEFAPHDLEDLFALLRTVGPRIVGEVRAREFEVGIARPLAAIGGSSFGSDRPRVLGIVSLDPPVAAGGHSFETDLIEIAGGQSATHGGEDPRLALDDALLARLAPDLLLVITPEAPTSESAVAALDPWSRHVDTRVFPVRAETFWLEEGQESARRLRALIAAGFGERRGIVATP